MRLWRLLRCECKSGRYGTEISGQCQAELGAGRREGSGTKRVPLTQRSIATPAEEPAIEADTPMGGVADPFLRDWMFPPGFCARAEKPTLKAIGGAPWDGPAEDNDQPERKCPRGVRATLGDPRFACHAPIVRARDGTARKRCAKHSLRHLGGYIGQRRKIHVPLTWPGGVRFRSKGAGGTPPRLTVPG